MFWSLGFILIAGIIFSLIAYGMYVSNQEETTTYEEGVETIAVVIDPQSITGKFIIQDDIYVKYNNENGEEKIAMLNLKGEYPIGHKLKIKFTPGKYESAVFMSDAI